MCWEPSPQHGKGRGGGAFKRVRFSGQSKDWSLPVALQPHLNLLPSQVPVTVKHLPCGDIAKGALARAVFLITLASTVTN